MIKKFLPVIGIALFVYLLYKIGIDKLYGAFKTANIYYILVAIVVTLFYTILQTLKWDLILKRQDINVRFYELLIMQAKSVFYGIVTPGRLGSFIKVAYLKERLKINFGKAVSSVLIDKILDMISIFSIAFIGSIFLVHYVLDISYAIFFIFIFVMILIYIIFNKNISKKLLGFFYNRLLPEKYKEHIRESFYSFYENLPRKKHIILPFIVNLISWVMTYTIAYIIAVSLDIKINYFVFITIYAITTIVGLIPITISGLGTREVTLIGLLGIFGLSAEKSVAVSLISLLIIGIMPALIGLIFVLKEDGLYKTRQKG